MTLVTERSDIEQHFETEWAGETAIEWPNVDFSRDGLAEYVSFHTVGGQGQGVSIGTTIDYRTRGIVQVNVFVRKNTGTARARVLGDMVINALTLQKAGGVQLWGASQQVHPSPPAGFYGLVISASFQRDDIRTQNP